LKWSEVVEHHMPPRRRNARRTIDALIHSVACREYNRRVRCAFLHLVDTVRSNSELLQPYSGRRHSCETHAAQVVRGLINLANDHKAWVRPCEGWHPQGSTPGSVFTSLVNHLIDVHPVPKFMVACWLAEADPDVRARQRWYIHLARAGTIRGTSTPCEFDKEQAKCFATAPDHFTIPQALHWGQQRRRIEVQSDEEPHLYNISRRRRKAAEAESQQWCRGDWKPIGIHSFQTDDIRLSLYGSRSWTIREILTRDELVREGTELNHCVATYAGRCLGGLSSIWSLKVHGLQTTRRVITIEIEPRKRTIVTALGDRNTSPSEDARRVMDAWARVSGLHVLSSV